MTALRKAREVIVEAVMASLSLFIHRNLDRDGVRSMVIDNFRQFFRRNLTAYQRQDLPVGFVGSMAFHYRSELEVAAEAEGYCVGTVLKSPLEGLIAYHQAENF